VREDEEGEQGKGLLVWSSICFLWCHTCCCVRAKPSRQHCEHYVSLLSNRERALLLTTLLLPTYMHGSANCWRWFCGLKSC